MKHPIIIVTLSREARVEAVRVEYSSHQTETVSLMYKIQNGEYPWVSMAMLIEQVACHQWYSPGKLQQEGDGVRKTVHIAGVLCYIKEQEVIDALVYLSTLAETWKDLKTTRQTP